MSEQALIFEVGESGFDRYVIENSYKVPVLVEFMGVCVRALRCDGG